MLSYIERLKQSKESKDSKQAEINAREAHITLLQESLNAEKRKTAAIARLEQLKGQFPLNALAIIEAQHEAEAAEENFMSLVDLSQELFPDNTSIETEPAKPAAKAKPAPAKKSK